MFARFTAWLFGSSRSQPCADAQMRRSQIMRELRQAEARGDCRAIGKLRMHLAEATTQELTRAVWP